MFRVYHKGEGGRDATERGELLPLVLAARLLKALCPTGDCLCHLIGGLFIIWKVIRKSRGKMMNLTLVVVCVVGFIWEGSGT